MKFLFAFPGQKVSICISLVYIKLWVGYKAWMSYLDTIVLCIVGLCMPIMNQVGSWIAWGGIIKEFEVLVVSVMWGGSLGYELP